MGVDLPYPVAPPPGLLDGATCGFLHRATLGLDLRVGAGERVARRSEHGEVHIAERDVCHHRAEPSREPWLPGQCLGRAAQRWSKAAYGETATPSVSAPKIFGAPCS